MNKKNLLTPEREARIHEALEKRTRELYALNFPFPMEDEDFMWDTGDEMLRGSLQGWWSTLLNNYHKAWRLVMSDLENGIELDMNTYKGTRYEGHIDPEDFK